MCIRDRDRAAVKLEKAEAKIPKKTVKVKKRVVDSESGKVCLLYTSSSCSVMAIR